MLRLLLAAAAAGASNRGHEVAQFVRARAGLLKSIVLFRTHVDDALTVRIYRTLHASLKNAKNYDLHILYDPDALPTCCTQFDEDASSIKFGLQEFEENYPNVGLQMHKGLPALKKSHYQQLAYAFALRGKDYEFAWCVEHDVALTGGNWLGFYEAHANDSRDLLAWRVGWVPKDAKPHKGGAWNAGMMKGPRFDCFHNDRGGWPFSTCHGGHSEVAILFGAIVRLAHGRVRRRPVGRRGARAREWGPGGLGRGPRPGLGDGGLAGRAPELAGLDAARAYARAER